MGYSIHLVDPVTRQTLETEEKHFIRGGQYAIGGTRDCYFYITYNYSPYFYQVMGPQGIRSIYGLSGAESIPVLKSAISKLGDDVDPNYWEPTEGNAKKSALRPVGSRTTTTGRRMGGRLTMLNYRDRTFCVREDCPVETCDCNRCHVPWASLPEWMGVSMADFYGKSCFCPVKPPKLPDYWGKEVESDHV